MAYACQMAEGGFVWWYRNNHIKGDLSQRFEAYDRFIG